MSAPVSLSRSTTSTAPGTGCGGVTRGSSAAGRWKSGVRACVIACTASGALLPVAAGCGGRLEESVSASSGNPQLLSVVAFAETETSRCGIPGGAVAIVVDGKVQDYAGFGVSDDDGNVVTPETLFLNAGVSKAMVAAAAVSLSEKGELSFSSPVTAYVPLQLAQGFDPSTVTMQTLLTHTSGIPYLDTGDLSCATGPGALAAWFATDNQEPLWTTPGEVWNFSQRGYAVAGWAIGAAAKLPFEDAMSALVFGPSGMSTATYEPGTVLATNHAVGHFIHTNGSVTPYQPGEYDCAPSRAADGVYASVLDDAHFVEALYAGGQSMMAGDSLAGFMTGQTPTYFIPSETNAYGFYANYPYKGLDLTFMTGDIQGYQSALVLVPASRFAVVVLFNGNTNQAGCAPADVANDAIDTYLGVADVAAPDWQTPPSTWQPLLGTYYDPYVFGTISVTSSGSNLVATTAAYGDVTLTQDSATAFVGIFGDTIETVTFEPDASGPAAWFVSRLGVGQRQ